MAVRCFVGSKKEGGEIAALVEKAAGGGIVEVVADFNDFLLNYKPSAERVFLFVDRYYFGFHIENQIYRVFETEPKTAIVMCGEVEFEKTFAFRMYNTGIQSMIDHILTGSDTVGKMERVLLGGRVFPERIAEAMRNGEHLNCKDCYNAPTVTEYKLFSLLSYGFTHKELCARFGMSESMVGTYIERVRNRLGAKTTAEAVRIWCQTMQNSNLEDDEYDSACGWSVQQGMFFERDGFDEVSARKHTERHTGLQCRHLQERACGCGGKKRGRNCAHGDEYGRPRPR